jgi:hypothetical protein
MNINQASRLKIQERVIVEDYGYGFVRKVSPCIDDVSVTVDLENAKGGVIVGCGCVRKVPAKLQYHLMKKLTLPAMSDTARQEMFWQIFGPKLLKMLQNVYGDYTAGLMTQNENFKVKAKKLLDTIAASPLRLLPPEKKV